MSPCKLPLIEWVTHRLLAIVEISFPASPQRFYTPERCNAKATDHAGALSMKLCRTRGTMLYLIEVDSNYL